MIDFDSLLAQLASIFPLKVVREILEGLPLNMDVMRKSGLSREQCDDLFDDLRRGGMIERDSLPLHRWKTTKPFLGFLEDVRRIHERKLDALR